MVEGVVKSDDVMSQILSGKMQPTDTVENVMVKGFKVVSSYTGNKFRRQIIVICSYMHKWENTLLSIIVWVLNIQIEECSSVNICSCPSTHTFL